MKFGFFRFRRTEKMDSVMKGLTGQCPPPRIENRSCTENIVLVEKSNTPAFYHMKYTQPARA